MSVWLFAFHLHDDAHAYNVSVFSFQFVFGLRKKKLFCFFFSSFEINMMINKKKTWKMPNNNSNTIKILMCTLNFDKHLHFLVFLLLLLLLVFLFIMRNLINITYITSTRKIINISHEMNYDQLRLQSIYLFIECSPVQIW